MNFRPLSPVIGAEVSGIDLRQDLSGAELASIEDAFATYHLLLFREQEITPQQQRRFVEHFGPLRDGTHLSTEDGQLFISNRVKGGAVGDGELAFHSDHSFFEVPDTDAILLYGIEIPPSGGDARCLRTR